MLTRRDMAPLGGICALNLGPSDLRSQASSHLCQVSGDRFQARPIDSCLDVPVQRAQCRADLGWCLGVGRRW